MHWGSNTAESGERGRTMNADFYGGTDLQGGNSQRVGDPLQTAGGASFVNEGNATPALKAGLKGTLLGGSEGGELSELSNKNRLSEAGKAEIGDTESGNAKSGKNESRMGESGHTVPLSPEGYVFDFSSINQT